MIHDEFNGYQHTRLHQQIFAKFIARLRPWTYFITLTYAGFRGDYSKSGQPMWEDILEWAKSCQRKLKGYFEFVLIPETPFLEQRPHLHGLLYLTNGASTKARDVLSSYWPHGFTKVLSVQRIKSGFFVARYMLKEFNFMNGQREVPFFISPSLLYEMEQERKKDEYRKTVNRRMARERKFWREGARAA
jgi:hypothetical protein